MNGYEVPLIIILVIYVVFGTIRAIRQNKKRKSSTTNCRDCRGTVSLGAEKCPHCGAQLPAMGKGRLTVVVFILYCLVSIACGLAVIALFSIIK